MTNLLLEVKKILNKEADFKVKSSVKKFVPTVGKCYGVKLPVLNKIADRFKHGGFRLTEVLWKSGIYEEQILAVKILSKICGKEPDCALNYVKKFSGRIADWAVCDALATQGIRKIARTKQKEIFAISRKYIVSKNLWQRRFGIVLLINFSKDKKLKAEIKKISKIAIIDKEYYVKKAVVWLANSLKS